MKYLLVNIFLFCIVLQSNSQTRFYIEKMIVYHYNTSKVHIVASDYEEGPSVSITCVLKNISKDTITLHPPKSDLYISFRYHNIEYSSKVYPYYYMNDHKELKLQNGDSIKLVFSERLFLGRSFYVSGKRDYTKEIIKVLPTISLEYDDKRMSFRTNEILNVECRED